MPSVATAQEPPASDPDRCPSPFEVLVERGFAAASNLSVGDDLRVGPAAGVTCRATIAGIFEPPPDPATLTRGRPRILMHLPDLARLAGRIDEVDRFTLVLRPGVEADAAGRRIESSMPGVQALTADRLAAESSATFEVIQRFHRAIAWITLGATGVFLVCVMTLRIQQRRTPIAALRLSGVSRTTIAGWLLLESTLVAVLGGAAGLLIGLVASGAINRFYQARYDTELLFSIVGKSALIPALVMAVVLGLGAGTVALAFVFRTDALREVGR
jgi:putative ABC transport system permease protein